MKSQVRYCGTASPLGCSTGRVKFGTAKYPRRRPGLAWVAMIIRMHKYLWYRLYKFNLASWKDPLPALSQATAAISALIFWYVLTILGWVSSLTSMPIDLDYALRPRWELLLLPASIVAIILLIWVPKGRYKKIIEEFDALQETSAQRISRALLLYLYIAIWIALFIVGFLL